MAGSEARETVTIGVAVGVTVGTKNNVTRVA